MRRFLFGYVKPLKPELKIKEYDAYKAVYCGLCRQLGRSYGPVARLTLSYDFTFLCMLACAVGEQSPAIEQRRCCVNPTKKVPMCVSSEASEFCADVAAIMLYYKLLDNIADSGAVKAAGYTLLRPMAAWARKKAAKARPAADALIAQWMREQAVLEQAHCDSVDAASEPTAKAMAGLCTMLGGGERNRRVLERLGYLVGRYVYLCDALDDLEQDMKSGGYNPFLCKYTPAAGDADALKAVRREAAASLNMTVGEIGKTAELLEMSCFAPVILNIAHLGLKASADEILSKKETGK